MSSSLELNSDTSTFSPSDTLVSETHSRPEARTCASEGRSRFKPDFITLTRLNVGWRGPRFLFLASFATSITSSQHLARRKKGKEHQPASTDQPATGSVLKLPGISGQQWPEPMLYCSFYWAMHIGQSALTRVCWYQPLWLFIDGRESERVPLTHTVHATVLHFYTAWHLTVM